MSLDTRENKTISRKANKQASASNVNKIMNDTEQMRLNEGVTIKDLRLEDKKRVADLIKELAKINEDREKLKKELNSQRQLFETRINEILNEKDKSDEERANIFFNSNFIQNFIRLCKFNI
ncbi:uncharacterized protein TRIADDRAFT_52279 [Trichoplax adhaerens]|uniref:Uncharacterized protein n=1 Tax=Trichoplax adhaerens TaxID=10228 RepID=B3RM92_TRIAD|nr:hypothetical protein TRIADDRAFT_52279 [Trichoplax adhaerens]EDV29658.1 hypothetical protein TRIADDRAFT_52279 [Trichoplax adhaerens]|eukprot:XP_002108860.1 hypothetical protein TRIADDRAFT_52279 [Trichoplax adhaerens]